MKTRLFSILLVLIISTVYSYGQTSLRMRHQSENGVRNMHTHDPSNKFSPEKYEQQKKEFIIQKTQLSQEKAEKVIALLQTQRRLQRTNDRKIKELRCNENYKSNIALANSIIKQINELKEDNLKIELQYQKKILKIISASQYLEVIQADFRFDREMLSKLTSTHRKSHTPN